MCIIAIIAKLVLRSIMLMKCDTFVLKKQNLDLNISMYYEQSKYDNLNFWANYPYICNVVIISVF